MAYELHIMKCIAFAHCQSLHLFAFRTRWHFIRCIFSHLLVNLLIHINLILAHSSSTHSFSFSIFIVRFLRYASSLDLFVRLLRIRFFISSSPFGFFIQLHIDTLLHFSLHVWHRCIVKVKNWSARFSNFEV